MNKKAGYRATWDPGKPLEIGFVGKLDRFGTFSVYTTLEQEGITPRVKKDESSSELDYTSTESVSIEAKASGTVPSAGSVLTNADAGFVINLNSDRSVVFKINGYKTHQITNLHEIEKLIIEKYKNSNWEEDWYIISELVEADQATIIISNSNKSKLELKAKADATADKLTLTNASLGLTVAKEQGSTLKFITQNNLTPLYKVVGVKNPFVEDRGESGDYELREIDFNDNEIEDEEM